MSISEAYIQEQVDNSKYLGRYNVRKKGTDIFIDKRWVDDLGNLCQLGFSTTRPPIFWKNNGGK